MKLNRLILGTIIGTQFAFAAFAADETKTNDDAEISTLKQQIQDLAQKVNALESERQSDQEATMVAAKTQPKIVLGANGLSFSSADSNFVVAVHGLIQLDSRTFPADGGIKGNDGFILRRARPIILSGTVFHDFDFLLTPEFAGTSVQVLDAYLNYRYRPELQLQVGKFKSPLGLEALQADTTLPFNERSLVTDLVPNRDLGVELHGDLFSGRLSYAAGIFDGSPDFSGTTVNSDNDDDKAFVGRIFAQPWKKSSITALKGLGFGLGGSYEVDRAATNTVGTGLTAGYLTDGQQKFFSYGSGVFADGAHWRLSPQAYYYYGPFSWMGEYAISDQRVTKGTTSADLQNTAWEISSGWVLTGENASYTGVIPKHPFSLENGGWGAWQIVARYADLDVDKAAFPTFASLSTSASSAHAWAFGINWYLNNNVRLNTSFSHTQFTDGKSGAVTAQPENVLFTRVQLAF